MNERANIVVCCAVRRSNAAGFKEHRIAGNVVLIRIDGVRGETFLKLEESEELFYVGLHAVYGFEEVPAVRRRPLGRLLSGLSFLRGTGFSSCSPGSAGAGCCSGYCMRE